MQLFQSDRTLLQETALSVSLRCNQARQAKRGRPALVLAASTLPEAQSTEGMVRSVGSRLIQRISWFGLGTIEPATILLASSVPSGVLSGASGGTIVELALGVEAGRTMESGRHAITNSTVDAMLRRPTTAILLLNAAL